MITETRINYYDRVHEICTENNNRRESKRQECNEYVKTVLQKQYPFNIGMVFTKAIDDIENKNMFMIWIDKGASIEHKYISIADCNIKPLKLLAIN